VTGSERLAAALVDRYTIERELGAGGMATVYLAQDVRHHRQVALKVLRPELTESLGAERFLREIQIAAALHHPHILPLYDSGEAGGFLYYVMPLAEGESLRDRLRREKQLPIEESLRYALEIADALSYAHSKGLVHRDIKPENILVESGHAVVADFGIARAISSASDGRTTLTEAGVAVGTPGYMSPEQAAGEKDLDGRSDLYSLACVLFEMLAGQPPFTGPTAEVVVRQHVAAMAPPVTQFRPAVPAAVADAIARALAKNPADRFNPVGQFATAISGAPPSAARLAPGGVPWRLVVPAVLAVVAIAVWLIGRAARGGPGTSAEAGPSVAVLPFVNLGGDPANDYFGDGITEEILNALAQLPGLQVAARTSAFQFKGKQLDLRDVGRQLGVAKILEGSVQRSGDEIRITAQLIDARTGYHLWSGKFDRRVENLFAVEDEISRIIADTLKVPLGLRGNAPLVATATRDPAAHDFYLRGLSLIAQRGAALAGAIANFDSAIARDSSYAPAWAGLGQARELSMWGSDADVWRRMLPLAEAAARRALALDSTLALTHMVLGSVHRDRWQWAEADREYQRGMALAPGDPEIMDQYAQFLANVGDLSRALHWEKRAARLNPLAPNPLMMQGRILAGLGSFDSARVLLRKSAARVGPIPSGLWIVWTFLAERRFDEAVAAVREFGLGEQEHAVLVGGAGDPGRRATALGFLRSAEAADSTSIADIGIPQWYALLGDTAGVLRTMKRSSRAGFGDLTELWMPPLGRLRSDPRFLAALRPYGLPYNPGRANEN